jgi:hypothetical protein
MSGGAVSKADSFCSVTYTFVDYVFVNQLKIIAFLIWHLIAFKVYG